ncbi:MAG: sugar phosphate isomerase/epimerase [Desulfosarcina sp.]|nr:sugar phosphate isomerase/epimerase [Desulfosarcina sp.]MBC2764522.1 sugar phosphate isomerase/epimerase [Desulfosarcina sp.]
MQLGYNTNGFAHHRLVDAIEIVGRLGYRCVAITLDHCALDPWGKDLPAEIREVKAKLTEFGLSCVIETGARFLLDPWRKHEPTMLSHGAENRRHRLEFLKRAVDIAVDLNAAAVSFWSGGNPEDVSDENAWQRLVQGCREVARYAGERGMPLGFEPEPGMFIETLAGYERLKSHVASPEFKLTLDIGHALITEDICVDACIRRYSEDIVNIHLEDMKKTRHDHLFFGDGEIDFKSVFQAIADIRYTGPICVELSRHSHQAVETARLARYFLSNLNLPLTADTDPP